MARWSALVVSVALLAVRPALAEELSAESAAEASEPAPATDAPATPTERAPVAAEAPEPEPGGARLVVLVLPLVGKRVDEAWVSTLDDLLVAELAGRGELKVTALTDVNELIAHEQRRDLLGCEEVACAAEVGGALGADRILTGSVGHLGERYVLTLRWLDVVYNQALAHVAAPLAESSARRDLARAVAELLDGAAPTDAEDRRRKRRPTFWTAELGGGGDLLYAPETYDLQLHANLRLAWGGRAAGLPGLYYAVAGFGVGHYAGSENGLTGRLSYQRLQLTPFVELRAALPVALRERTRLYVGLGGGLTVERYAARQSGGVRPSGTLVAPELRAVAGVWHRWHRQHSVWGGYLGRVSFRGDGADSLSELVAQGSTRRWLWGHAFEVGWAVHF